MKQVGSMDQLLQTQRKTISLLTKELPPIPTIASDTSASALHRIGEEIADMYDALSINSQYDIPSVLGPLPAPPCTEGMVILGIPEPSYVVAEEHMVSLETEDGGFQTLKGGLKLDLAPESPVIPQMMGELTPPTSSTICFGGENIQELIRMGSWYEDENDVLFWRIEGEERFV